MIVKPLIASGRARAAEGAPAVAEEVVIKPYQVERRCEPSLDVAQLTFKTVTTTESVYTRALIHLQKTSLPSGIQSASRRGPSDAGPGWQPTAGIRTGHRPATASASCCTPRR
jgi:hypothetical protein